jgi:hypothetical protein
MHLSKERDRCRNHALSDSFSCTDPWSSLKLFQSWFGPLPTACHQAGSWSPAKSITLICLHRLSLHRFLECGPQAQRDGLAEYHARVQGPLRTERDQLDARVAEVQWLYDMCQAWAGRLATEDQVW